MESRRLGLIEFTSICLFIAMVIFPSIEVMADHSWSQLKGDQGRTGSSEFSTLGNMGGLQWTYSDNASRDDWHGFPTSCVIDSNGTIYFGDGENSNSGHGELIALNPDGSIKWLRNLTGRALSSPAIGGDGNILITDGNLTAFSPEGQIRWHFDRFGSISGSPLVTSNGTIYAVEESKGLICLSWNGTLIWNHEDAGAYGTPSLSPDNSVLILSKNGTNPLTTVLRSISPSGSLLWEYGPFMPGSSCPCVASDGTIYIGCEDNCALSISKEGSLLWRFDTVGPVRGVPSLDGDGAIIICTGYSNMYDASSHWDEFSYQRLYALAPNGTILWSVEGSNYLSSPSISSNGDIFVVSGPSIMCYNSTGAEKWSYTWRTLFDRWSPNSIAIGSDGAIYISTPLSVLALKKGTPGYVQELNGNLWGRTLKLSWEEPESIGADRILEYRIYVSHIIWGDPCSQTDFELLASVPGIQTSFQYDEAQLYDSYQVVAVNEYGESMLHTAIYIREDSQESVVTWAIVIFLAALAVLLILFVVRKIRD